MLANNYTYRQRPVTKALASIHRYKAHSDFPCFAWIKDIDRCSSGTLPDTWMHTNCVTQCTCSSGAEGGLLSGADNGMQPELPLHQANNTPKDTSCFVTCVKSSSPPTQTLAPSLQGLSKTMSLEQVVYL